MPKPQPPSKQPPSKLQPPANPQPPVKAQPNKMPAPASSAPSPDVGPRKRPEPTGMPASGTVRSPVVATPRAPAGPPPNEEPGTTAQGQTLAMARILSHVVAALELLTKEQAPPTGSASATAGPVPANMALAREELVLARTALGSMQGAGDALLSPAGRLAKSQQRADPSHSSHFGG